MKVCIAERMMLAIASLLCAAFLVQTTFAQSFQEGRVTSIDFLDAKGVPTSSDSLCAALGARIYTIETDKATFKMLGALVEGRSDDERRVYFVLDSKKNAHFENPNGGEQPVTLVAYQTEWKEVPVSRKVLPVGQMSRDWRDAKLIGVQPLLDLGTFGSCMVSRPVGWVYILEVDGLTYDAMWKEEAPLQLWVKEHTSIAWRGSDRIYLIDDDEKERTLAVRKRTQPTSERASRYSSSKPEDSAAAPAKEQGKSDKDSATKNAPDQPAWDPLRAEKDLEVGQHYMHKGDYDAAIDRFQDAIVAKPGYAIPFRYLGEAQEKKGLRKQAIKSYQRYLDLYPHAEDAEKIKKKLDKLWKELQKEKKD